MKKRTGDRRMADMALALRSIAHPARLEILMLLGCEGELSVSDMQKRVGLTQSMTSQHLAAMRASGVLLTEKRRNRVFYSIRNKDVLKVIACMKKCAGDKMA